MTIEQSARDKSRADQFLQHLGKSQLLTGEQLDLVQKRGLSRGIDALVNSLIMHRWLTPYQARRLMDGQSRGLVMAPYVVLDMLGEGGFGTVFKAYHQVMKRVVALKVIAPKLVLDAEIRQLFLREVVATTRLTHPNIALAYDADEADGDMYLAMEYVNGPNLGSWVAKHGPLPIPYACALMLQAANALQYTHEKGMLHRDIKPGNLLLCGMAKAAAAPVNPAEFPQVLIKLIDFGLARLRPRGSSDSGTIRQEAELVGTPEFMSPEQVCDFHAVDIRSDLYSLGCVFYFALTGRCPHVGVTRMSTISLQLHAEPQPLSTYRRDVPPAVAEVVLRLLAKKPDDRLQTPAELASALSRAHQAMPPSSRSVSCPLAAPGVSEDSVLARPLDSRGLAAAPSLAETAACSVPMVDGNAAGAGPIVPHAEQDIPPIDMPAALAATVNLGAKTIAPPFADEIEEGAAPVEDMAPALWRDWLAIVGGYAADTPGQWNEVEYKALHTALLKALRWHPESVPAAQVELYSRLQALVEPWLTLRSIRELDRKTLHGFWATCRQLDAEFPAQPKSSRGFWKLVIALLIVGGVFASSFLMLRHGPGNRPDSKARDHRLTTVK